MSGPLVRLARRGGAALIRRDLRRAFRRVVWAGRPPAVPEGPLVLYANHHYARDSYLLWLLARTLGRPAVVWMEAWAKAPLFGPLGALPFPPGDARARARAIRETARRMRADPRTVLFLYPEATLGPPDAGLAPFRADLPRLARLFPDGTRWWPVAVRATWWGESAPTALLAGGPVHDAPDGHEAERLRALLDALETARPGDLAAGRARVLLDGRRGAEERWDLSPAAPFFRRLTFRARSKRR